MAGEKIYLLDTSVLIYDPESLYSFARESVAIPIIVLEELDRFKTESTERGAATREVIRRLDALRLHGSLKDGVTLENGGTLQILFLPEEKCSSPLKLDIADNEILLTALSLRNKGFVVQFISKDLNARIKADAIGINAQDYVKEHLSKNKIYKGWIQEEVASIQLKKDVPDILQELVDQDAIISNQFILLTSKNNPHNYKIYRFIGNRFKQVDAPNLRWPLEARNPQQLMALDLLFDPEVALVSLIGPAGTGKTFLALLAGLHQVLMQEMYRKMLISRPVIPLGPDIGYLPGTIEEKLHSWMQPMYDNMEFITHAAHKSTQIAPQFEGKEPYVGIRDRSNRKHRKKNGHYERENGAHRRALAPLDQLTREGKISLEAITYMRGRSIPFQYILIDEVQNLTPHEVKTLISRVGEGSKIILAGDPYQIDAPYLDFSSNGLVVASNKFKGERIFGTVFLENSERSELSKLASELL
jgi:PhoH-like ATPase